MKPETLEALNGSIRKWELIVQGNGRDYASENCPLCARFININNKEDCARNDGEKCPVRIAAKRRHCNNTPYKQWIRADSEGNYGRKADTPERKAAAQAELDFLRSLLPDAQP